MAKKKQLNKRFVILLVSILGLLLVAVAAVLTMRQPKDPDQLAAKAEKELKEKSYAAATADLSAAAEIGHKPAHYLALADAMLERRKEEKGLAQSDQQKLVFSAIRSYREAVRYDQGGRTKAGQDAQRKLADIYEAIAMSNQDWESYIKEASELLRMDPKDSATRFKIAAAKMAMMATRPEYGDQALEEFKQLVQDEPGKDEYWLGLARYYFSSQNQADGAETLKQAMAAVPDSVRLRTTYAEYLQVAENKKPEEALALLTDTLAKNPDNADVFMALAIFYQRQNQVDKSIEVLRNAIAQKTVDYRPYRMLASLYMFTKEYDKVLPLVQLGLDTLRQQTTGEQKLEGMALGRQREGLVWLNYVLCDYVLDQLATASEQDKPKLTAMLDSALNEMTGVIAEHPLVASVRGRKLAVEGDLTNAEPLLRRGYEGTGDRKTAQALVNIYLRTSQPGDAKRIIQSLVTTAKDDPAGMMSLARMCAELEQYDEALAAAEEVLKKHPEMKDVAALTAALKIARGAITRVPDDIRELDQFATVLILKKAEEYWNQGDSDSALRLASDLYDRQPRNLGVILDLIVWRRARNEAAEVQALMDRAKRDLADDPAVLERLNMALTVRDDPSQQLEIQLKLADQNIKDPIARMIRRADIYSSAGDREKALADLNEVIKQQPDNAEAVMRLFGFAIDKNDWDTAQKYVDQAAKENLDKCHGKWFQAIIHHNRREYDKAIEVLNEVLQERPRFSQAEALLGECYFNNNQLDKAKEAYAAAYDQDPKNVAAIQGLINVADRTGQMSEYNKYMEQAYRMFPGNAQVRERYLQLVESQGDMAKALRQREQVARTQPRDGQNLMRLAMLYERNNQASDAGRIYQTLYESAPKDATACRMYANFLLKTGRDGDAQSLMAKFANDSDNKLVGFVYWADFLEHAGQVDKAKTVYEKSFQYDQNGEAYASAAQFYQRQGNWPEAVKCQKEYIQRVKDKNGAAAAQMQLVELLISAKQFDESQKMIDAMLKDKPNDADVLSERAAWHMAQKDYGKARDVLDGILANNPQAVAALLARSEANQATGDTTAAIADLEAARRAQPRMNPQVPYRLAELYILTGDVESADLLLQKINEESPDFVPARTARAQLMIQKQQWDQAAQFLTAARRLYPKETGFPRLEAQMWLQRKQVDKALAALRDARAVAIGPEQTDIDLMAARMLIETGEYDKALPVCQALLASPNVAVQAHALIGRSLAKKGDQAGAEEAFTTALKAATIPEIDFVVAQMESAYPKPTVIANLKKWESLGKDGWRIQMHLGQLTGEAGDNKGAAVALTAAAAKAPDGRDKLTLYNVLAVTYQNLGQYEDATKTFELAIKMEPNDGIMHNNLAFCLGEYMHKYAEALPIAEKAAKLAPNNASVMDTYGMILLNLEKYKEAEDALTHGLKVQPLASSRYYLGQTLEKQGRKDEALEQYRLGWETVKKDEKDPNYQKLKQAMEHLGGSE